MRIANRGIYSTRSTNALHHHKNFKTHHPDPRFKFSQKN